jgi:hypothetical protein
MDKKNILIPVLLLSLFAIPLVASHQVVVRMYLDKEKTDVYSNEFMWIYLQNKTYEAGQLIYNATCYRGQYTGGFANITVPTGWYDILAVDGAITWNNETDCPEKVENYDVWATAQSNMYVDGDRDLDYFVNTTLIAPPRQYFFNMVSFRAIMSIIAWLIIGAVCFVVAWKTNSGLAVLIIFIILLVVKLLIGI